MSRFVRIFSILVVVALLGTVSVGAVDRGKPALGQAQPFVAKPVQQFKLSNGIPVYFYAKPGLPLVSLKTWIGTGAAHEAAGQYGLASLTATLMTEGAGGRDALALAESLEMLGARLSISSTDHSIVAGLNTTLEHLAAAGEIYRDILLKPDFPEAELQRAKESRLNGLLQTYDDAYSIGMSVFFNQVYGDTHPYGRLDTKEWNDFSGLTRDQLTAFHQNHVHAGNMAIVVAGAIDATALQAELEKLFGQIPAKQAVAEPNHTHPKPSKRRILLVDKPGAAQSFIGIGHLGVALDDQDYAAVKVMNTILGGSFASRLNQNIREEHGYAYNASSHFIDRAAVGPFLAMSNVQTDATAPAVKEFFNEFERMTQDVTASDVDRAKNYLMLGYPSAFGAVDQISDLYSDLLDDGLPLSVPEHYTQTVAAVTLADVQRVAKKFLQPKNMLVLVVGDRAKVEKELKALKMGKLTVQSIEQALGEKPKKGA